MIIFFEKTGCKTNKKQKSLLLDAGYELECRDLREVTWDGATLLGFFEGLDVKDWFNKAAPEVKSGEIKPDQLEGEEAITMMMANPLLIRRPLLQTAQGLGVGFEEDTLARLGLKQVDVLAGKEGCSNEHNHACPDPKGL